MDQLSLIKWTIMEKAKFGLHSLNAEKKKAFLQQHGLVLRVAAAGGQLCCYSSSSTNGPADIDTIWWAG